MIKLFITDLDNTIYNWVDFYMTSFNSMIKELSFITGIAESVLRPSFKKVHQKHRTSEYAFSIQELDVLSKLNAGLTTLEISKKYHSAITAFRTTRKKTLRLYKGVEKTLKKIRSEGIKIVGHTDAMIFYAMRRIKQLGIEDYFDGLAAQVDHTLPNDNVLSKIRTSNDPEQYKLSIPYVIEVEPHMIKPNSFALNKVLKIFDSQPFEAIYLGDSINRDIHMANKCGVTSVLAKYGQNYEASQYRQLVEITHWNDEDVALELELKDLNISPSYTISKFEEVLGVIQQFQSKDSMAN